MKSQVTSIEQSRRLLELGVPAEKASMVWYAPDAGFMDYHLETKEGYCCPDERDVPAFTIADLLRMLPSKISWQDPSDGNFRMRRYRGEDGIEWVIYYDRCVFGRISIIDTLVETIECLVANGYKLEL